MKSCLIIDDHSVVIFGLQNILQNEFGNIHFEFAINETNAIKILNEYQEFSLIILDINIPNSDVFGLIRHIKNINPLIPILIFTMNSEFIFAKPLLKAGVNGFINKCCNDELILIAIKTILSNKKYLSLELKNFLANEIIDGIKDNPFNDLTEREFAIALYLINGKSIKEIQQILYLQPSTIGTHKSRIFQKCNVKNVYELIEKYKLINN